MDRVQLSQILNELIAPYVDDDKKHVFFQSPSNHKLTYPSIIYSFNGFRKLYANNGTYRLYPTYSIQLIGRDPDSDLIEKLAELPYCSLDRTFVSDNLHHYNYTIYC